MLEGSAQKKDVVDLRVSLSSRPIAWIDKFCALNGIRLLLQLSQKTAQKVCCVPLVDLSLSLGEHQENPSVDDEVVESEALRCVSQLLKIPSKFKMFVSHPDLTALLALALSTRNLPNRCTVLSALNSIASTPQGHQVVLDAFTHYQAKFEYQNRFQILVESLFEPADNRDALQLRVNALTLINNLLKDVNDLRTRFEVRAQFLSMGINDFINDPSHLEALQTEISLFLDVRLLRVLVGIRVAEPTPRRRQLRISSWCLPPSS